MFRLIVFFYFLFNLLPEIAESSEDKEILTKIENAWNDVDTMSANFMQINADGTIDEGIFYLKKPYKSRFEYLNKQNEIIITNRNLLNIVDSSGYQIDGYPLGDTPLKKIMGKGINLSEIFNIKNISQIDGNYQIEVLSLSKNEFGQATFYFSEDTFDLKKWEIIDEFENLIVLEFTNLQKNISLGQNLFVIRYN